jgi:hypothetical protein
VSSLYSQIARHNKLAGAATGSHAPRRAAGHVSRFATAPIDAVAVPSLRLWRAREALASENCGKGDEGCGSTWPRPG